LRLKSLGTLASGAGDSAMTRLQYGTLDKLAKPADLRKDGTRQSDNLTDQAARALQTIQQVVLEHPQDASLRQILESFRRALRAYDDSVDASPRGVGSAFWRRD